MASIPQGSRGFVKTLGFEWDFEIPEGVLMKYDMYYLAGNKTTPAKVIKWSIDHLRLEHPGAWITGTSCQFRLTDEGDPVFHVILNFS